MHLGCAIHCLVSTAQPGIWIIDATGNTVFANERMAEILGVSISDMVGQSSFLYVFPEDLERAEKLFDRKKHRDSSPFEFRLRRGDGSAVRVHAQGTPMHDGGGKFLGVVGTFSPITT